MKLLKKENWWIWLMLAFLTGGSSVLVLGALLDVYEEDAWYCHWMKKTPKVVIWIVLGMIALALLATTVLMSVSFTIDFTKVYATTNGLILLLIAIYLIIYVTITVFQIQILAQVNAKLNTPGSEIYLSPYIWILGLIIPVVGWILLLVMYLYLQIWYLVMLYRGIEKEQK